MTSKDEARRADQLGRALVAAVEAQMYQEPRLAVAREPAVGAYVFDLLVLYGPHEALVLEVKHRSAVQDAAELERVRFQCDGYRKATGFPVLLVTGDAAAGEIRTMLFTDTSQDAELSEAIAVRDLPRRVIEVLESKNAVLAAAG